MSRTKAPLGLPDPPQPRFPHPFRSMIEGLGMLFGGRPPPLATTLSWPV